MGPAFWKDCFLQSCKVGWWRIIWGKQTSRLKSGRISSKTHQQFVLAKSWNEIARMKYPLKSQEAWSAILNTIEWSYYIDINSFSNFRFQTLNCALLTYERYGFFKSNFVLYQFFISKSSVLFCFDFGNIRFDTYINPPPSHPHPHPLSPANKTRLGSLLSLVITARRPSSPDPPPPS